MPVTLTVDLPETAFSVLRTTPEKFLTEMKQAAIVKWYELGRVSQSKGAEILNTSRVEFLEILKNHNVSPFQLTEQELDRELEHE